MATLRSSSLVASAVSSRTVSRTQTSSLLHQGRPSGSDPLEAHPLDPRSQLPLGSGAAATFPDHNQQVPQHCSDQDPDLDLDLAASAAVTISTKQPLNCGPLLQEAGDGTSVDATIHPDGPFPAPFHDSRLAVATVISRTGELYPSEIAFPPAEPSEDPDLGTDPDAQIDANEAESGTRSRSRSRSRSRQAPNSAAQASELVQGEEGEDGRAKWQVSSLGQWDLDVDLARDPDPGLADTPNFMGGGSDGLVADGANSEVDGGLGGEGNDNKWAFKPAPEPKQDGLLSILAPVRSTPASLPQGSGESFPQQQRESFFDSSMGNAGEVQAFVSALLAHPGPPATSETSSTSRTQPPPLSGGQHDAVSTAATSSNAPPAWSPYPSPHHSPNDVLCTTMYNNGDHDPSTPRDGSSGVGDGQPVDEEELEYLATVARLRAAALQREAQGPPGLSVQV